MIVQKFGGTSLATVTRIREVARQVAQARAAHDAVVVVVSAMGRQTDELVALARGITTEPSRRELDMLLTAGERISMSLMSMALNAIGTPAISFTGSQSGIITDTQHTRAKIVALRPIRIDEELQRGKVVIVAGFQGVSPEKEVTTLGRGGSDTTAVALAARLGAKMCEIFTDVQGVYTADPRIVSDARLLSMISYDEMVQLAASGSRVLHPRSVDLARTYKIPLWVRSSFNWNRGTLVTDGDKMESVVVTGVTSETDIAKVAIKSVPDKPGVAAIIFQALATARVNIKFIIQSIGESGHKDITVLVPSDQLSEALDAMESIVDHVEAAGVLGESDIGRVSIVGAGMAMTPGVAATMFEALASHGINIDLINTSEIRIDCIIGRNRVADAVAVLHGAFGLNRLERKESSP